MDHLHSLVPSTAAKAQVVRQDEINSQIDFYSRHSQVKINSNN